MAMIHFDGKSLFKRTRFFLAVGIISWFVVFPVYLHLSLLDDLGQIFPNVSLKAVGQDYSAPMFDPKEKILIHTFGVKRHSEVNFFSESARNFYPNCFDPGSKQFILRC
jgi:hypothetical protein